jgi:hypothetical protein
MQPVLKRHDVPENPEGKLAVKMQEFRRAFSEQQTKLKTIQQAIQWTDVADFKPAIKELTQIKARVSAIRQDVKIALRELWAQVPENFVDVMRLTVELELARVRIKRLKACDATCTSPEKYSVELPNVEPAEKLATLQGNEPSYSIYGNVIWGWQKAGYYPQTAPFASRLDAEVGKKLCACLAELESALVE